VAATALLAIGRLPAMQQDGSERCARQHEEERQKQCSEANHFGVEYASLDDGCQAAVKFGT
jgi:hypothetical protein